ncbi:MAG: beta-galactosidase [Clostridia bacterium]|nr:beta-galactosidase [Clostridia bacterium]
MKKIDLNSAVLKNVTPKEDGIYTFSKDGGMLIFEGDKGTICSYPCNKDEYVVFEATNLSENSTSVTLNFWDKDQKNGNITVKIGLLPHVKTVVSLKEESAEGGVLFLKRKPGRLKTVVLGTPVKLKNLTRFAFGVAPSPDSVTLKIHDSYICEVEPEYNVPDVKLVDTLGQKKITEWPGKTKNEEDLKKHLLAEYEKETTLPENCSNYGGWLGKRFEPTGFFALEKDDRRYWLKDPDGYAFISCGLDCVGVDGDCNLTGIEGFCDYLPDKDTPGWSKRRFGDEVFFSWHKYNLYRTFGENWYEAWTRITKRRLIEWGENTVACWSDMNFIKNSNLPYVHILHGFPRTTKNIFRDFPDVFSPEYKEESVKWAQQLEELKNDKNMIGCFMSNEPHWAFSDGLNIAAVTLEADEKFCSKDFIVNSLKAQYEAIESLNKAWETAFATFDSLYEPIDKETLNKTAWDDLMNVSAEMVREFIKVPALAIKEVDPNHLNLGMRYAWVANKTVTAGCEYFDVFSFNCYRHDPYGSIQHIVDLVDMPVMIGEFHFGALDRGLDATGIQGVASQEDRAKAYRYYMHRCASHPYCLGAHYFTLNDQGYLGRFDGENYQIGFVDVCNKEYPEIVESAKKTNREVYLVANGDMEPTDEKQTEINSICY